MQWNRSVGKRGITVALLAVAGLGIGVWTTASGQNPGPEKPNSSFAPLEQRLPTGCLQVVAPPGQPITAVVYDSQQKALGVYHIDHASGEIELKSVRRVQWDLEMLHYNGKKPLPEEIRRDLGP